MWIMPRGIMVRLRIWGRMMSRRTMIRLRSWGMWRMFRRIMIRLRRWRLELGYNHDYNPSKGLRFTQFFQYFCPKDSAWESIGGNVLFKLNNETKIIYS